MKEKRCIPHVYFQRRCSPLTSFRNDPRGARFAIRGTLEELMKSGRLQKVGGKQAAEEFNTQADVYFVILETSNE